MLTAAIVVRRLSTVPDLLVPLDDEALSSEAREVASLDLPSPSFCFAFDCFHSSSTLDED